jgi:hypothetical protein
LKSLKVGYSATGSFSKSKDEAGGIFRQLYAAGPVVPVYYADGTYGDPTDYNLGDGNNFNPQVTIDYYNQNTKKTLLTGNAYAELSILKGLTFKTASVAVTRRMKPVTIILNTLPLSSNVTLPAYWNSHAHRHATGFLKTH